jgi:capsid assembly protease
VRVVFNSPGGSLDGLDQAYQALTGIANIATGYNAGDAASAAYWLACAIPRLEPLTPTAAAGSIGVVATMQDYSGYLDQWGVKEVTITNTESPNKRPNVLTEEGIAVIRKELDGYYDVFTDRVTATRPLTREAIDALKGEMLISKRAVAYGLMDAPLADTATADNTKNEFEGGVTMDTLNAEMTAQTADQIATAVSTPEIKTDLKTERTRIIGLLKVSGSPVSAEVLTAIETGVDVGAYAVAKAEADAASAAIKAAAEKAEVDAARALRETAATQNISGIKAGNLPNTTDAKAEQVDKLVEKVLPKKKGGI